MLPILITPPCPGLQVPMLLACLGPLPTLHTPIFKKLSIQEIVNPTISKDFCILPPELGHQGNVEFLEDCPSLDRWGMAGQSGFLNTSLMICLHYSPKV